MGCDSLDTFFCENIMIGLICGIILLSTCQATKGCNCKDLQLKLDHLEQKVKFLEGDVKNERELFEIVNRRKKKWRAKYREIEAKYQECQAKIHQQQEYEDKILDKYGHK